MIERAVGCGTALNDCYRSQLSNMASCRRVDEAQARVECCDVSLRCAGRSFLSRGETA